MIFQHGHAGTGGTSPRQWMTGINAQGSAIPADMPPVGADEGGRVKAEVHNEGTPGNDSGPQRDWQQPDHQVQDDARPAPADYVRPTSAPHMPPVGADEGGGVIEDGALPHPLP
jgi:hypothetical protein